MLESERPLGAEAADVAVATMDAAACADCGVSTGRPSMARVRSENVGTVSEGGFRVPYCGLLGHEAKGRRRLVVDRGQGANVAQQLVQQGRLQVVDSARGPERLVREHDSLHDRTWTDSEGKHTCRQGVGLRGC